MSGQLLDVNVLLALLWPRHQGHSAAHAWFARSGQRAWATSPLTQLGVLRLLTNPAVTQGAVNATTALVVLTEATRHAGHEYWPLNGDVCAGLKSVTARLQGHQQWTDAALLWQAIEHKGVLVTFDAGIKKLADREQGGLVLVLKHG